MVRKPRGRTIAKSVLGGGGGTNDPGKLKKKKKKIFIVYIIINNFKGLTYKNWTCPSYSKLSGLAFVNLLFYLEESLIVKKKLSSFLT